MSTVGDSDDEMLGHHHLDDETIESFLSGRNPATEGLGPLAAFADDVQLAIDRPVPAPTVSLAAVLAKGFSTETGDLPATAASNVTGPAPQAAGLPKWRKRMVPQLLSGIAAKLAGLGMAAKAGLGLALAGASVTGAGAAGVLPDPAQNAVAEVVGAVTPFEFPDGANDNADFGDNVGTDATDENKGVDGADVSDDAKHQGDDAGVPADAGSEGQTGIDEADETPAADHTPTTVPASPDTADPHAPEGTPTGQPATTPTSQPEGTPTGQP